MSRQPVSAVPQAGVPVKRRAPTLYIIIAFKLCKGLLLLLLALGVYRLADNNLPDEFRSMIRFLHLDPEKQFFSELANRVSQLTAMNMVWIAGGTTLYSLFSLVEGIGLIFRVSWAGWMAIGESLFFIPLEVYDLAHKLSIVVGCILALNVLIVWYLYQNRVRLFPHHQHPGTGNDPRHGDDDGPHTRRQGVPA